MDAITYPWLDLTVVNVIISDLFPIDEEMNIEGLKRL